jgi:hypothetical protein
MSDCITEAEGVYDPNAKKKKKQEEKGECNWVAISTLLSFTTGMFIPYLKIWVLKWNSFIELKKIALGSYSREICLNSSL